MTESKDSAIGHRSRRMESILDVGPFPVIWIPETIKNRTFRLSHAGLYVALPLICQDFCAKAEMDIPNK